jgi:hypothetical protein
VIDDLPETINFTAQVGTDFFAFVCKFEVGMNVVAAPNEISLCGQHVFQTLAFAHYNLRFFGVRPQAGVSNLLFYFGQLFAQFACVKGTPAGRGLCL